MTIFVQVSLMWSFVLSIQYADARNVALGKPAYQTDTYTENGEYLSADRAVDGNTSGDMTADKSCAQTIAYDAVWSVDLGDIYQVSNVTIYNRIGYFERLQNVELYTGVEQEGPCSLVGFHEGAVGASYTFTLSPHSQARYVNITRNPPYLYFTLCEVEVESTSFTIGTSYPMSKSHDNTPVATLFTGFTFATYPMSKYHDNTPVATLNNVRSLIGCAYACYMRLDCLSTNYNAATLTCEVLEMPLEELEDTEDASSEYTAMRRIP